MSGVKICLRAQGPCELFAILRLLSQTYGRGDDRAMVAGVQSIRFLSVNVEYRYQLMCRPSFCKGIALASALHGFLAETS